MCSYHPIFAKKFIVKCKVLIVSERDSIREGDKH